MTPYEDTGRRGSPGRRTAAAWVRGAALAPVAAALLGASLGLANAQTMTIENSLSPAAGAMQWPSRAPGGQTLDLKIILAPRHGAALDRLLDELQDPRSPRYHKWLTPAEFTARFGSSEEAAQQVEEWLRAEGFRVVSANRAQRLIRFSGSVLQAERTFRIRMFASADGRSFGSIDAPSVPARFAGTIVHLEGLDNLKRFVHVSPVGSIERGRVRSGPAAIEPLRIAALLDAVELGAGSSGGHSEFSQNGSAPAFGPADLYTFYDENSVINSGINGAGKDCIALVEDSNYLSNSVTLFDNTFTLAAAGLTRVFPTTDPGTNADQTETLLDVEWAHAIAPGAPLRVYIGNGANPNVDAITDGIQKAVDENLCSAISVSFAECGASASSFTGTLDPIFKQAAVQGQSVFVSAGDQGAAGLSFNASKAQCVTAASRNVNELSTDPNVTSVGGTEFVPSYDHSGNDIGSVAEQVWDEAVTKTGATGGGVSTVFTKPAYQTGVTPADGQRDVPDVSMIASPDMPGVFLGDDNGGAVIDCCIGGTSLAAPIWAGISRLIVQAEGARIGNINARIYKLGSSSDPASAGLRDVTSGSNGFNGVSGFTAGPGYDLSTGWGTADIAQLIAAFPVSSSGATPTPTSTATPTATPTSAGATPTATAITTPTAGPSSSPGGGSSPAPTAAPTGSGRSGATPTASPGPTPVPPAPVITIVAPTNGPYGLNQAVTASYSCTDARSAVTRCSGTVASGSVINTSSVGTKTFTVTATNSAGRNATQTVNYTVVPVTPASLTFAAQFVGTTSSPKVVTVINKQNTRVKLSGIAATSNFREFSNCPHSLLPGTTCTVTVVFAPRIAGLLAGQLTVVQNSTPYRVSLSGVGTQVRLSPPGLSFPRAMSGTTTAPKKVTLFNRQSNSLNVSSIQVSAGFVQSNTCGSLLAPLSACQISVAFAPTGVGSLTGALTVNGDSAVAPQAVALRGVGFPQVSLSLADLSFGKQVAGRASSPRTVTLVNNQGSGLAITGISIGGADPGDFAISSTSCRGNQCVVSVTFAPTGTGTRSAVLTIGDRPDPKGEQIVGLSGTGI